MSRTYNLPSAKVAGTFGQELPGIPADRMIADRGEEADHLHERERRRPRQRRLRQNGAGIDGARCAIELYDSDGRVKLETKYHGRCRPTPTGRSTGIFQELRAG